MTILSIVNPAIADRPDPRRKIQELSGCRVEPDGYGGRHASNVTLIFDNNTAAGWVKLAMKLNNPRLLCVIYCG